MRRDALESAYRSTRYLVRLNAGELELRVDRASAEADARLGDELGCRRDWALVTPCNPRSVELPYEENALRCKEIERALAAASVRFARAVHRDPTGAWPDEASFLLVDPPRALAERLGREFEQNAVVVGELGAAPRLVWIDP